MDTLSVTATLEHLDELMDYVRNISLSHSADAGQLMAIELAVEEVVVNIINYAYPDGSPGTIELSCQFTDAKQILISIADYGVAYNPLSRETPDIEADIDHRGVGGLGVFLTIQMMDDVCYKNENGKNILTMVKNLT